MEAHFNGFSRVLGKFFFQLKKYSDLHKIIKPFVARFRTMTKRVISYIKKENPKFPDFERNFVFLISKFHI